MGERNYSMATLKKMLDNAHRKYDEAVMSSSLPWGYGMRHSKLPSTAKFDRLEERIKDLKRKIAEKEREQ